MNYFDPTGMSTLMPGQQPSQSQLRWQTMLKMVSEEFKGADQYVMVTPKHGPSAVKCLTAQHAAQMIYDGEARKITEDELAEFNLHNEKAKADAEKEHAKTDLAKSVQRILRD